MRTIPLPNEEYAIVDDEDYEALRDFNWHISNKGYIRRNGNTGSRDGRTTVYMAVQIMSPPPGVHVDHINGDKKDCRRFNLRWANVSINNQNRRQANNKSGFIGVSWHRATQRYMAQISKDHHKLYLGIFDNAEDAARIYDSAAIKYYGARAKVNFRH